MAGSLDARVSRRAAAEGIVQSSYSRYSRYRTHDDMEEPLHIFFGEVSHVEDCADQVAACRRKSVRQRKVPQAGLPLDDQHVEDRSAASAKQRDKHRHPVHDRTNVSMRTV